MKIPLFCITKEEGVAIPSTTVLCDISLEHAKTLYTYKAKPQSLLNPTNRKKQLVVIGHVHDGHDPLAVSQDLDLTSQYTYKIGTLCELIHYEIDELQNIAVITLKCLKRVIIHSLHKDNETPNKTSVELEYFTLNDIQADKVKELLEYIEENSLIPTEIYNDLSKYWDLTDQLDTLAGYIYQKDPETALSYLQLEQGTIAVGLLSRSFKDSTLGKTREHHKSIKPTTSFNRLFTFEELKSKISQLGLPEGSKNHVSRELSKLSMLKPDSHEYMNICDYLNLIAMLPWGFNTNIEINIKEASKHLNETHYGLQNVKNEILEHLAIQQHLNKVTSSVLCFSGAPGTGKTTIANQIAIAANRPIIRIACGGMGDDSDLKGFRRTYVGSRPGRLINGLKETQSSSPLILLDEIDKLSVTRQDAMSALLEILDPNQNKYFIDKYLEIPYDLSNVMFICTANDTSLIPAPLRDRLDIIEFTEYTGHEKEIILTEYMFPKAIKEYQLEFLNLTLPKEVQASLLNIPGLRQMEKQLKRLLRNIYYIYLEHSSIEWNKDLLKMEKEYVAPRVGF